LLFCGLSGRSADESEHVQAGFARLDVSLNFFRVSLHLFEQPLRDEMKLVPHTF
jgi:hypothetical protein